jgi:mRNA interferase YafQ
MREITKTTQFKKEFKLMMKRGRDEKKIQKIFEFLIMDEPLPAKYKDHKLIGDYEGSREVHIESDWLLIYQDSKNELILERTGTHSDLFKK